MGDQANRTEALEWVLSKLSASKKKPSTAPVRPPPVEVPKPPTFQELKPTPPKKLPITREQKDKELELWKTWKDGGMKSKDLNPLLKSFSGLINDRINRYRNRVEIPVATIEHRHKIEFVNALKTYDPSKGAALPTHIHNRLKKVGRFIQENQNFARITENIGQYIGSYNAVKSELTEKFGFEPDAHTLHDHILKINHPKLGKLSLKDVQRLEREQRRGLIQTGHDVDELGGSPILSSRAEEVKHLIVHQLTPDERAVHEYTFGLNGKPALKPGEIAKKLKMDNSKVAKLRTSIWNKMKPHLGGADE